MKAKKIKYTDRDISWLSFNARILQEAASPSVPVIERLKFLAIYSSNLEEFYKVRVAGHRFEQRYKGDVKNKYGYRPSYILQQINLIVSQQQEQLGKLFYTEIVKDLAKEGIQLLFEDLQEEDEKLVSDYFDLELSKNVLIEEITDKTKVDLKNLAIYLYILWQDREYLLDLDYANKGRFITLSDKGQEVRIIQLDDIYKKNIHKILGEGAELYAVKVSKDAELYMDDEQDDNILKKIRKSIAKRDSGLPSRLLFNENIPYKYINNLRVKLGLDITSLISGGQYHSFYDYFQFPEFNEKKQLYHEQKEPLASSKLEASEDWFEQLKSSDVFLSFPYQDFKYVHEFLRMAANDDLVEEISTTIYRVNKSSEICSALELAAQNGKQVFVFDEVLARFDEESNMFWGERLEKAGAVVKYSLNDLKVHAKVYTIKRRENGVLRTYAYLGTGNLNEKTAKIYADHGILTSNPYYTEDLNELFKFLKDEDYQPQFKHLLVAPFILRKSLNHLIENEMAWAEKGEPAEFIIKLNSLEDPDMIDKIREAADSGVKIKLTIRGICCYHPKSELQEQNIKVVSVIDKYLEHTRIYHFNNNGAASTYLASADWMSRNLSKRIEVAFPVYDKKFQALLVDEMNYQLNDNQKGRLIACKNENAFVDGVHKKGSQERMYDLVEVYEKSETL